MGTLFSALDIGRAGLQVAQVQLDVTAHNIANVSREGYSRQRVDVTTRIPNVKPFGAIGRGPAIAGVNRLRDTFLDGVYRNEVAGLGFSTQRATIFSQMENIFQEPSDDGFATRLGVFFDAMNDFADNVEDLPSRVSLLAQGESLSAQFRQAAQRLRTLRTDANEEVRNLVPEINTLARQIADSNQAVNRAEVAGRAANDLRDTRDLLLDKLARLANITTREREDGQVDVLLGGEELVIGVNSRELIARADATIDPSRPDLLQLYFADSLLRADVLDGELAGALRIRDGELRDAETRLNTLAAALIEAINGVHSQGNGINAISLPQQSANGVSDPALALNVAGLPFTVQDGSFDLIAYDSAGTAVETVTVPVTAAATTLNDIAAALNGSASFTAAVDASGRLTITPAAGLTYSYANDTAALLPALGMNGFFTGVDAQTIGVSQDLLDDPTLVSSAFSADVLETGDNTAALAMAALRNAALLTNGTETLNEYFESTVVQIGIQTKGNLDSLNIETSFVNEFDRRRQETSGVNIDEEVTSLVLFQRAFEASSRVITVTDRMLDTLLNIVR